MASAIIPKSKLLNEIKNGKRVRRLVIGDLPKQLVTVKREACAYRRLLEDEVLRVHNKITATQAHLIDLAASACMHAGICRWLLRKRLDKMATVCDRLRHWPDGQRSETI